MIKDLQRTAEWLEKRKGRVTGSLAGAALGLSPWMRPDDVIRMMVREYHGYPSEFQTNPAIEWGVNHESQALLCFQRVTGLHVEKCGFFPYEDWSGASPDGLVGDNAILEIKVPYGIRKGGDFKSIKEQSHYEIQLQLEMLATGRNKAYFFQYCPAIGEVFDHYYIEERHKLEIVDRRDVDLSQLKAFHDRYLSELDNKAYLEPKRVIIVDKSATPILERIDEIDEQLARLAEERKGHIEKLVTLAGNKDAEINGRNLTLVKRKGSVSAAALIKKYSVPEEVQEELRGKPSDSWRLT